jgi:hypothetical protein
MSEKYNEKCTYSKGGGDTTREALPILAVITLSPLEKSGLTAQNVYRARRQQSPLNMARLNTTPRRKGIPSKDGVSGIFLRQIRHSELVDLICAVLIIRFGATDEEADNETKRPTHPLRRSTLGAYARNSVRIRYVSVHTHFDFLR